MAALPRKWVSGGLRLVAYASESAPTLPWMNEGSPRRTAWRKSSQRLMRLGKSYSLNQQFIDQHLGTEAGAW
jgi:hypothetical protein